MTWEIFLGISALVSFMIAVFAPITKLTKTMTELNVNMKNLGNSLEALTVKNTESHRRIWEHNEAQDEKIENHEKRIIKIETKMDILHSEESK